MFNDVETNFPDPWGRLATLCPTTPIQELQVQSLLDQWLTLKRWEGTLEDLLSLDLPVVAAFFRTLESRGAGKIWSLESHSGWMESTSFVNVRALGRKGRPGSFFDAARILPALRARCIHLGPFTAYEHHCIYAVASLRSISSQVTDLELERRGFTREWQLSALVRGCQLLEKAAGFDLEPHVTSFAIPVLENPGLFRWIHLNKEKTGLAQGTMEETLLEVSQETIAQDVSHLVSKIMTEAGEETLEYENEPQRLKREPLHHRIIGELIHHGYWTIPSQYWGGDGVPEFGKMHPQGYPVFICKDREGVDQQEKSFNILTPFLSHGGKSFFAQIFPWWRDRFGFDFVRMDSVDHIFDSSDGFDHPRSDRPSPQDLKEVVERARLGRPGLGVLGERMGVEYEDYHKCGFDALLGADMFSPVGPKLVTDSLKLSKELEKFNQKMVLAQEPGITINFAVDTHDTGDPNLLGAPLVESCNSLELLQRQFLARFGSAGLGRRPKYEVVGVQDRSYGLFQANISEANLHFRGDRVHLHRYHFLEDIYEKFKPFLEAGTLGDNHVEESGAWWTVETSGKILLCALAFEQGPCLNFPQSWEPKEVYLSDGRAVEGQNMKEIKLKSGEWGIFVQDSQ